MASLHPEPPQPNQPEPPESSKHPNPTKSEFGKTLDEYSRHAVDSAPRPRSPLSSRGPPRTDETRPPSSGRGEHPALQGGSFHEDLVMSAHPRRRNGFRCVHVPRADHG